MSIDGVQSLTPATFCSQGLEKLILDFNPGLKKTDLTATAEARTTRKAIAALASQDQIDENLFYRYLSSRLSLKRIELKQFLSQNHGRLPFASFAVSTDFWLQNRCIPLVTSETHAQVAFADPFEIQTINELSSVASLRIEVCLAPEADIIAALTHGGFSGPLATAEPSLFSFETEVQPVSTSTMEGECDTEAVEAAPVVQLVNRILTNAIQSRASDIHLEPTEGGLEVRFRIDGVMTEHEQIPRQLQFHASSRIKLLSGMDIAERRRPQDGRLSVRCGKERTVDMRVSAVPTPSGEKIVIRVLSGNRGLDSLEKLGLPVEMQRGVSELLGLSDGIVLVTGPTGSGKTTTLYTCLQHLMNGERHVITVEDPIEFRISGVTQIQVDKKTNVTFASGLRSILRQDPDVILLGEIRDLETAETAFHAAQTGHLVLSTLHTIDAPSAISRLRDLGLESYLISSSLRAVLAQRLLRRVCPSCSRSLTDEEAATVGRSVDCDTSAMRIGAGCYECGQTGYRGRIGIYSLLTVKDAVRAAIHDSLSEEQLAQAASDFGYEPLSDTAMRLVAEGVTTIAEVARVLGFTPAMVKADSAVNSAPLQLACEESSRVILHPDDEPAPCGSLLASAQHLGKDLQSVKVLLVDDDARIRSILATALRAQQFEVFETSNGREALDLLGVLTPTIIICDLVMPVLNGREFVSEFECKDDKSGIPILMLTSEESEDLEIELLDLGATDFIRKTSSIKVIVSRIQRLIKGQVLEA